MASAVFLRLLISLHVEVIVNVIDVDSFDVVTVDFDVAFEQKYLNRILFQVPRYRSKLIHRYIFAQKPGC